MSLPVPLQPASTALPLPDPEAYPGEPREYARALMQRKDEIDKEIVSSLFSTWDLLPLRPGCPATHHHVCKRSSKI